MSLRATRFKLQRHARKLMPWDNVNYCGRYLRQNETRVALYLNQRPDATRAHVGNVKKCGSVWVCPVCSAKISNKRAELLKDALKRAEKLGYHMAFLTLTVKHTKEDDLKGLLAGVSKARRLMYNRKPWKQISKELGIIGNIRALEVKYNKTNGWHVHTHEILIYKNDEINYPDIQLGTLPKLLALDATKQFEALRAESIQSRILVQWFKACETAGVGLPDEHGVTLQEGKHAGAYASKWGLSSEMTQGEMKTGRTWKEIDKRGVTPWELLSMSADGARVAGEKFVEYAEAFRGRRQLFWSKGLAAHLNTVWLEDDQQTLELVDSLEEPEIKTNSNKIIGSFDFNTWNDICYNSGQHDIFTMAEKFGWKGVEAEILYSYPTSPMGRQIYNRIYNGPAGGDLLLLKSLYDSGETKGGSPGRQFKQPFLIHVPRCGSQQETRRGNGELPKAARAALAAGKGPTWSSVATVHTP